MPARDPLRIQARRRRCGDGTSILERDRNGDGLRLATLQRGSREVLCAADVDPVLFVGHDVPPMLVLLLQARCWIDAITESTAMLRRPLAQELAPGRFSRCHGHRLSISSTRVQLRKVRTSTRPASRPRLVNVSSNAIVFTMSAATRTSRPSRRDRPIRILYAS